MKKTSRLILQIAIGIAIALTGQLFAQDDLAEIKVLETVFSDSLDGAEPNAGDKPAGWENWKSTPEQILFYDKTFGRNDTFSIGIENAKSACWMISVTATPGATYRFSGYVKTDSNGKGTVSFSVRPVIINKDTKKAANLVYQQASSDKVVRPGDWEYIEAIYQAPLSGEYAEGKLNELNLICQVRNSPGKVWFDDLKLEVIEIAGPFVANFKDGNKSVAEWKIYAPSMIEGIYKLAHASDGYGDAGALAVEYVSGKTGYATIPKDPILRRNLDGTNYWTLLARARSAGDAKPGLGIEQLNEAGKVIDTVNSDKYPAKDARWHEIKLPFILNDAAVAVRPLLSNNNQGQAIFDNVYLRRANQGETAALLKGIKPIVWMTLFPADFFAYIDNKPAALTLPSGQAISFFIQLAGDTKAAGDTIVDVEMPDSLSLLAATVSGPWSDNQAVPFEKMPSKQPGHGTFQFKNPYELKSIINAHTGLMLTVKSNNPAGSSGKIIIRTKRGQIAGETRELPFLVRQRIAKVPKINDFKIGIWNLIALCNRDDSSRKELFQTYIDAGVVLGGVSNRHAFAAPLMREQGFTPMSYIPGIHEQWAFNFLPEEKRPAAMVLADGRSSTHFTAQGQALSDKVVIENYKNRLNMVLFPDVKYAVLDVELWGDGEIKNSCFHPSTIAEFRKFSGIADGIELNAKIILTNHLREWAAFRHYATAKLHGNASDYVREIRPGAQLLAYDYLLQLNGQANELASYAPMNTLENDKYVDVHLISTYGHEGAKFLDSVDSTVKHLKKPVWTVPYISEGLAAVTNPGWGYHHPATQELRMEVLGAAASGAKGFVPFSGILLDADRLSAINSGAMAVAKYQDFYSKGTRADNKVTLLNPDKDVRHRVHELSGKTLLTIFNCGANPAKVAYKYNGVIASVDIPENDFRQICVNEN